MTEKKSIVSQRWKDLLLQTLNRTKRQIPHWYLAQQEEVADWVVKFDGMIIDGEVFGSLPLERIQAFIDKTSNLAASFRTAGENSSADVFEGVVEELKTLLDAAMPDTAALDAGD